MTFWCAAILLACGSLAEPELSMRAGLVAPEGAVIHLSEQGVRLRRSDGAETEVSWDRIAALSGTHAKDAEAYRDVADQSWRARTRLARGDGVGAEPLFEQLFERYGGTKGATASAVAEGLMICRVRRGTQAAAVLPLLGLVASGTSGALDLGDGLLTDAPGAYVDGQFGLVPAVPPIWLDVPATQALARGVWDLPTGPLSGRAALLSELYRAAAAAEVGDSTEIPTRPLGDPGAELVWEIVVSRIGQDGAGPSSRSEARDALRSRLKGGVPTWVEAWSRCALGRSLLKEGGEQGLLGAAELLALPARLERENPLLTGIALAEVAVFMHRRGDGAGAARLKSELITNFPGHPALEWPLLRTVPYTAAAQGQGTNPSAATPPSPGDAR